MGSTNVVCLSKWNGLFCPIPSFHNDVGDFIGGAGDALGLICVCSLFTKRSPIPKVENTFSVPHEILVVIGTK